jgi:hypothetical protein
MKQHYTCVWEGSGGRTSPKARFGGRQGTAEFSIANQKQSFLGRLHFDGKKCMMHDAGDVECEVGSSGRGFIHFVYLFLF